MKFSQISVVFFVGLWKQVWTLGGDRPFIGNANDSLLASVGCHRQYECPASNFLALGIAVPRWTQVCHLAGGVPTGKKSIDVDDS